MMLIFEPPDAGTQCTLVAVVVSLVGWLSSMTKILQVIELLWLPMHASQV